jgi:hypothetical protein
MTYHGSRFSHDLHSSCNILRKKKSHPPTFVLTQLCILTCNEKRKGYKSRAIDVSHKWKTPNLSPHVQTQKLPSLWFSPTLLLLFHQPYLHCHILNANIIIKFLSKNNKPKKESHKCACNILKNNVSHDIGLPLLTSFMNAKTQNSKITIITRLHQNPKTLNPKLFNNWLDWFWIHILFKVEFVPLHMMRHFKKWNICCNKHSTFGMHLFFFSFHDTQVILVKCHRKKWKQGKNMALYWTIAIYVHMVHG